MLNISEMQNVHKKWEKYNFGDQETFTAFYGIVEEVGELSHSMLKKHQMVRQNENHDENTVDAIGDIFIFLMSLCTKLDIDMESAILTTWTKVINRDWIKYPNNGETE